MSSATAGTMSLTGMNAEDFRQACSKFATGVTVASVIGADGVPHGMTANSFTSVSLNPPLVLICIDHSATVLASFRACPHFGISMLDESQQYLSARFAQKGQDRFDGVDWMMGSTGVPLLVHALATLECKCVQQIEAGDHTVLIAEVLAATMREGRPLVFFNSGYRLLQ